MHNLQSRQWGEQDSVSTRASSILQMWRDLEGERVMNHSNVHNLLILSLFSSRGDSTVAVFWKKGDDILLSWKINNNFVFADEVLRSSHNKSLFFARINAVMRMVDDKGENWIALHRIPPFSLATQTKILKLNDLVVDTLNDNSTTLVIYLKDRVLELLSRTWVSGTAITAFYNRNLRVIAVDSRCFNARRQRSADGYDKLIFVSLTIVLAGTGRRGVIEAVQVALPVMLGNRGFHTAQDAIDNVVSSINTILIDGFTDYSANENAFVMLCFVNDEFGIALIEINADGSEFVGVRRGGYPLCVNEGCGAEHMAQFQARCPLVREVDMDTMDERVVGWGPRSPPVQDALSGGLCILHRRGSFPCGMVCCSLHISSSCG